MPELITPDSPQSYLDALAAAVAAADRRWRQAADAYASRQGDRRHNLRLMNILDRHKQRLTDLVMGYHTILRDQKQ